MKYLSFGTALALSFVGLSLSTPVIVEKPLPDRITSWVNKPWDHDILECKVGFSMKEFTPEKIIAAMDKAVRLEGNGETEVWPNQHEYPRTLETNRVEAWINWPDRGNKETQICDDKTGQVVLYPISNTKSEMETAGPYRVAMSKKFNMSVDSAGRKVRTYAFCGLAKRIHNVEGFSYYMCVNYQRMNLQLVVPESEEDPEEEFEQNMFE